jgi:SAM-dependent methyltransferase
MNKCRGDIEAQKGYMMVDIKDLDLSEYFSEDISDGQLRIDPDLGRHPRERVRDLFNLILRRPFYKIMYKNYFNYLPHKIQHVLPEKGFSAMGRRKWLNANHPIRGSRILVLGCGNAFDIPMWFSFAPREILGIDLLNHKNSWERIEKYTALARIPTKLRLCQANIVDLHADQSGNFDIISSDAVFEHCQDMDKVLSVCHGLLKPGGIMYAAYGPLWYVWGGDHFSGRDKVENGYNHLLLNERDYAKYFEENVGDLDHEIIEGGGAGIFIKLDLFSKLSGREYLSLFTKHGFRIKELIVEFCGKSVEALARGSLRDQLLKKYPSLNMQDYILKSQFVILEKET